ncbi:MAG TPA: FAD-dependent oxidoreductase, partial [Gemmatimonadales bacterium]|nr:FAD-dependent oxidoreductase [Gemmatimonadales bacterium]
EPDEVKARWPFAGPGCGALWAPDDAALDPAALVAALRADGKRLGVRTVQDTAISVERQGDRVTGVRGESGSYRANQVVLAAGAWSGAVGGVPRPVSVAPVRGQMAALPWPESVPPVVLYSRRCYMVYRRGEAVLGSTMEYVGFEPEVTETGITRILAAATTLCPALSNLALSRTWAGLRPVTPDGNPIIGAEPRLNGLWYATGHGRNGILLSGITGVIIRQLLDGEPGFDEVSALAPERFWTW